MKVINREPSSEDKMDAIGDAQRRDLLISLLQEDPPLDSPVAVAPGDDAETRRRRLRMKHVHLPKLADYGFIDWDRNTDEITKGQNFDEIRHLLEILNDSEAESPTEQM